MNNSLERDLAKVGVEVQTGTKNVALKDNYITGDWGEGRICRIGKGRSIALDLLNPYLTKERLVDAVLNFTVGFGPLTIPFTRSESFSFSISEWNEARRQLIFVWSAATRGGKRNRAFNISVNKDDGDHFRFEKGQITFRTQKLLTYAALEIASIPAKDLRRCSNLWFNCKSPFFLSSDLREKYCSELCAKAAKRRAKLKWWNDNRKEK